jgi:metallophosphoesterase superfamily enzyme
LTHALEKKRKKSQEKAREKIIQTTDVKRHLWVFIKGNHSVDIEALAIDWAVADEFNKFVSQGM